jgi:hypothetical protein
VFTEIDFDDMLDKDRKKLFVGLTRAQMAVEIILTANANAWFTRMLES